VCIISRTDNREKQVDKSVEWPHTAGQRTNQTVKCLHRGNDRTVQSSHATVVATAKADVELVSQCDRHRTGLLLLHDATRPVKRRFRLDFVTRRAARSAAIRETAVVPLCGMALVEEPRKRPMLPVSFLFLLTSLP